MYVLCDDNPTYCQWGPTKINSAQVYIPPLRPQKISSPAAGNKRTIFFPRLRRAMKGPIFFLRLRRAIKAPFFFFACGGH